MYHKLILIGNLGRDPELKYTPNGQAVASFSMATTEKWQGSDGQQQERTIWWRVSAFGKQAETIKQYLGKGSKVYVEGRMQSDTKTGGPRTFSKKDGSTGAAFELTAQTVKFLSPVDAQAGQSNQREELEPVGDLEQIPF